MNKKIIYLARGIFVFLFGLLIFRAQSQSAEAGNTFQPALSEATENYWSARYGDSEDIITTSDGGFVTIGYGGFSGSIQRAWIAKLSANGSVEWLKFFPSNAEGIHLNSVSRTSDGNYVIAGTMLTGNTSKVLVFQIDDGGNILWQASYGISKDSVQSIFSISETSSGYILTGTTWLEDISWVMKLDQDGSIAWQKSYADTPFHSVWETDNHEFILVGTTPYPYQAKIIKLDADGNIVWQKDYDSDLGILYLMDGAKTSDGGIIATGYDNFGAVLLRLNGDGEVIWSKSFDEVSGGQSVQETTEGDFVISGGINNPVEGGYVLKLDQNGNLEWAKIYPAGDNENSFSVIKVIEQGGFIALGATITRMDKYGNIFGCTQIQTITPIISSTSITVTDTNIIPVEIAVTRTTPNVTAEEATVNIEAICSVAKQEESANYWMRTYTGPYEYNYFSDIQGTRDGGAILTMISSYSTTEFAIFKVDQAGQVRWYQAFESNDMHYPEAVLETIDGGYILLISTGSEVETSSRIVKLDAMGNLLWQKTYSNGAGRSIEELADGRLILVGTNTLGIGPSDVWVMMLNSTGEILWRKTYNGDESEYARNIIELGDGGYAVIGTTYSFGAGGADVWVIKLDAEGNIIWQRTFGTTGNERGRSGVPTNDGGLIFVGLVDSFGAGSDDGWVVRLDGLGNISWQETIGGIGDDEIYDLAQSNDGHFILAGKAEGPTNSSFPDGWLIKLNADGMRVWEKLFGGNKGDYFYKLFVQENGDIFAAGQTFSPEILDENNIWAIKTNSEGDICDCLAIKAFTSTILTSLAVVLDSTVSPENLDGVATDVSFAPVSFNISTNAICSVLPALPIPPGEGEYEIFLPAILFP